MIKLNSNTYRDKIYACWLGKNIGGTMGGPFEGKRELLNVTGFTTPKDTVLPNDDLDLQLVWLAALERTGAKNLNAKVLGEYWLNYVTPHWNEYGIGKVNMQSGLMPPLCGDYRNEWKHSNGAWIRTEVWACLAPACPDIAVKYAYEDAVIDHGCGEGTIAAIFIAAIESAAFIENDIMKLINIGLSKIPESSRVAQSIKLLLELYESGADWKDARNAILEQNMDIGDGWFEAPSNVAYAILGLLYGNGDFKNSMLYAINCGDDTDCTAATVGSILGIMYGTDIIPADWKDHIGDSIVTVSIAKGVLMGLPETCTELTDRIIRAMPDMIYGNTGADKPLPIIIHDGETRIPDGYYDTLYNGDFARKLCERPEYSFSEKLNFSVEATIIFKSEPFIEPNKSLNIDVVLSNNSDYGLVPYYAELSWILPEGFSVSGAKSATVPHLTIRDTDPKIALNYTITAGEKVESINELALKIKLKGNGTYFIPINIMG